MTVIRKMRVGRKKNPDKLVAHTVMLPRETIAAINRVAGERQFSAWLREIVERELSLVDKPGE